MKRSSVSRRRRAKLTEVSELIEGAFSMEAGPDIEGTAHEVAHGLLLFGRMSYGISEKIEKRIDQMSTTRANRHEVKTCALAIAGLAALRCRVHVSTAVSNSFENLRGYERDLSRVTLRTQAEFARAIKAERPSKRNVQRFVGLYRAFMRWA